MAHRLLLIEQESVGAENNLRSLLTSATGLHCDRFTWDAFVPEAVTRSAANLVVAGASSETAGAMNWFAWLRAHPLGIPTLAVLPEAADQDVVRSALDVVDDFTFYPIRRKELEQRVNRLLAPTADTVEVVQRRLAEEMGLAQLVGEHRAFTQVIRQLPAIARSEVPVLITGETGTGKELCARAIHHLSRRRNFPFIAVDCAAIPDHLFENEFFGHARGAFTDAHRDQRGLVAMAEGGTLLLDEVDALSPISQVKLLRLLQERTFRPLGADRFDRADVNVIAATNRNLESCVRKTQFRSDLYFRLNVLRVFLPPLRERSGDVVLLARHFLEESNRGDEQVRKSFSSSALRTLALYDWPGNVRELYNVVQRAKVACEGAQILPCHMALGGAQTSSDSPLPNFRAARTAALEAFERRYVEELLRKNGGNVTHAAREARQDRRAFGRLVKKYNIRQAL